MCIVNVIDHRCVTQLHLHPLQILDPHLTVDNEGNIVLQNFNHYPLPQKLVELWGRVPKSD